MIDELLLSNQMQILSESHAHAKSYINDAQSHEMDMCLST